MMLTEKGTLKVLDFGIARLLGSARMTRAGNIIGTLEYMAPEQVRGEETDGRSDLYALGMMLYEVLTGKLPFDTDNEFELMKSQTEMTPTPPREINPAIPEDVEAAIMKAIQKNPDDRFQTGGEFREVLLDAGFAASGTMHGATGTFRKPSTHPSRPAISQSGAVAAEIAKPAIKETRLGEAVLTPPSSAGMKETRLGAASAQPAAKAMKATRLGTSNAGFDAVQTATPHAAQDSFFSKLTALHYAGAGIALLLLIGAVIAIPLMMSGSSKESKVEASNPAETKPDTQSQKPDVITMQQQQPTQSQTSTVRADGPAISQPTPALPSTGELTPIDNAPKTDKAATAGQKPPAPKKDTPAAPKPKADSKPNRAEKLLTGN
jgi:serine/threonine-protein kinase